MKLTILVLLSGLYLMASSREVDPNDFEDDTNAIFSLQIQVAKLQATEEANQWWLKSLGGGIVSIVGIGMKLLKDRSAK